VRGCAYLYLFVCVCGCQCVLKSYLRLLLVRLGYQSFGDRSSRFQKCIFLIQTGYEHDFKYKVKGQVRVHIDFDLRIWQIRVSWWPLSPEETILYPLMPQYLYNSSSPKFFFRLTRPCCPQRVRCPTFWVSPLRFRPKTDDVFALHPSVTFSV